MIDFSKESVFIKVNAKEDTAAARQYGIAGFPTVVLLNSQGEEIDRIFGYLGPDQFLQQIDDYMAGTGTFAAVLAQLEQDPKNIDLLSDAAERYVARARYTEAVATYEKIVWYDQWNEKGKSDKAILSIGDALLRAKQYETATDQFQRLMDVYPDSPLVPEAFSYKGYAYQRWGKNDEAIAIYEDFIKAYPNHEEAEWAQKQIDTLKGTQ